MSIQIVIDMNLSPDWVGELTARGCPPSIGLRLAIPRHRIEKS